MPFVLFRLSFNGGLQLRSFQTKSKRLLPRFLPTILTTQDSHFLSGFPCLAKRVVDAELISFGEDSLHDVNIPDRLMHDLIGNYFKPSAVVTALGGKHTLVASRAERTNRKSGACSPSILLSKYAGIRQQVIGSIDKSLLGYCCADPFHAGLPFCSEDYWHVLRALPLVRPKIVGAAPAGHAHQTN